jgi:hypothetical protein
MQFINSRWDSNKSTFKHTIYFKNGKILDGYSKKVNYSEKTDKVDCLSNIICRLLGYGYLDKNDTSKDEILWIEFKLNKTNDTFLRLFYHSFEWLSPTFKIDEGGKLIIFLEKFYKKLNNGVEAQKIINSLYINSRNRGIDYFNTKMKRFTSLVQLIRYCEMLLLHFQFPIGQVTQFYNKYVEEHFNTTSYKRIDTNMMEALINKNK